ncbi:unnamed protein product [Triticum turgidum subsp. durum]|uniref:beta-galactosidase n=1 Tax=Triticum turgidum subsp. durum TaxID=4567 RepID=A0A9R0WDD7_TRITD|nr:unnamed protein product [Triticum turgidum subsp. durum]
MAAVGRLPSAAVALLLALLCLAGTSAATNVTYDHRALVIDGVRRVLVSGSIHYPRSTPDMWPGLMQKAKDGGLDMVETYVFWDVHEPVRGQYDFEGRNDLVRFVKAAADAGLYVHLRIGPYVCAEWNYGGFPLWLHFIPGIKFRTDNEPFKTEMQRFTEKVVATMKGAGLYASQGGPIILSQIENEYGNIDWQYGDAGKSYMRWAAGMAVALDTGVPWVNSLGHVLQVFINGKFAGSSKGNASSSLISLTTPVTLVPGKNKIDLLSATVGLTNYGAFFDLVGAGITGPVKLTGPKGMLDLSSADWTYQIGLRGEDLHLYNPSEASPEWVSDNSYPTNYPLTWYKSKFTAPAGDDPVAIDFTGMGKGEAWVNGQSIGRYWPTNISPQSGCVNSCNYRGTYSAKKCLKKCGQPSQILYHVPRSFLQPGSNDIVLFEQFGGDPSKISFTTKQTESVCAHVSEDHPDQIDSWISPQQKLQRSGPALRLECPKEGQVISSIKFASFGTPSGTCGSYSHGECSSSQALAVAQEACVGVSSCSLPVSAKNFGDPCRGVTKSLVVEAACS